MLARTRFSCPLLLASAILIGVVGGCVVGETYDPNGASKGDDVDGPDGGVAAANCAPEVTANLNSGNHNAGLTCGTAGCHDGNKPAAPRWTVAGTVYSKLTGGAAVPGATIHITDNLGVEVDLVSAQNGNFYTDEDLAFPLTVISSRCPDTLPMISKVDAVGGNCNSAGCHDSDFRVNL